jgi:niacin transporter
MKSSALKLSISGLLIAVGIVIPMMSPLKIILEPASFTLASHVTIFIAMFISPGMAAAVAVGTTIGFFLGAFPIVIVFRAASHLVFATLGALWIRKNPKLIDGGLSLRVFSFLIGLIHGACELLVVMVFYFGGSMSEAYYAKGFPWLVAMVGLGTVVHSMVDLEIAYLVITPLKSRIKSLAGVSS